MIDSVTIKNFRCFAEAGLNDLGRVNVIVGANASGKTALMEGIFVALGGSPEIAVRFRIWRGLGPAIQVNSGREGYESLWNDLFYQHDQSRVIEISLRGTPENTRSLKLAYVNGGTVTIPLAKDDKANGLAEPTDSSAVIPIEFEWSDAYGAITKYRPEFSAAGLVLANPPVSARSAFYASSFVASTNPIEPASQYSALSRKNQEKPILDVLRQVYPFIDGLSLEISAGVPMVFCKTRDSQERIPLGMVSGGINKLVTLLLGIASQPKGVVLIDEVENGFYYKTFPEVWRALYTFATAFDVQLFVSTHSHECLRGIQPLLKDHKADIKLIRTERGKTRRAIHSFKGQDLEAAIQNDVEIR
jgi:hypothetical protein